MMNDIQVEFENATIKHHRGERRARRIKGDERKFLQTNLTKIKPSTVRNKGLLKMSPEQYISGNRDEERRSWCQSLSIPKNFIRSEKKLSIDSNDDVIISLMKLKQNIIDCLYKLLPNNTIPGYIQCMHLDH